MFALISLIMLLPQAAQVPAAQTAPAAPTFDQGPLRAEITAMREMRFRVSDPEMAAHLRSELGMQFRIRGERVDQIVRHGNLVLTEVIDDAGQSLVDPEALNELDKTTTRPPMVPADRLRSEGLTLLTRCSPSARGAKMLKVVKGTLRLILAEKTQRLTVDNPLQYHGRLIADPRLLEAGIEIEILPADEVEGAPPPQRCIVLKYNRKGEHVQRARFFDGWMRAMPARERWVTTKSGEQCQLYDFGTSSLDDEMQLVLDVHPQIEDIQLPIELTDIPLP